MEDLAAIFGAQLLLGDRILMGHGLALDVCFEGGLRPAALTCMCVALGIDDVASHAELG